MRCFFPSPPTKVELPSSFSKLRCQTRQELRVFTLGSSNMAGWKISELNGGVIWFYVVLWGKSLINGPFSKSHVWIPEGINAVSYPLVNKHIYGKWPSRSGEFSILENVISIVMLVCQRVLMQLIVLDVALIIWGQPKSLLIIPEIPMGFWNLLRSTLW